MYQNTVGSATTVAGITVLPNTGSNTALLVASIVMIVAGVAIIITTALRQAAKKAHSA